MSIFNRHRTMALPFVLLCLLLISTLARSTQSNSEDMPNSLSNLELVNLRTTELQKVLEKPVAHILMFMQPHCKWCRREAPLLEKIHKACSSDINVVVVGFNGNTTSLRREAKHFSDSIAVYKSTWTMRKILGGINTSPSFVFMDENLDVMASREGYLNEESLRNAVKILTSGDCEI